MPCRYILRVTKDKFRQQGADTQAQLKDAKDQLALVKRQSTVYQLFGRHIKNVLVSQAEAAIFQPTHYRVANSSEPAAAYEKVHGAVLSCRNWTLQQSQPAGLEQQG
jgi:hypothetical protein